MDDCHNRSYYKKGQVSTTSRKLKRLIDEEEKIMARIAEQQDFLKEIREARKKEEDLEIIKSIRSMKLGARDLFDLLTAIQAGNLSEELRTRLLIAAEEETDPDGNEEMSDAGISGDQNGAEETSPEREENNNDRNHD